MEKQSSLQSAASWSFDRGELSAGKQLVPSGTDVFIAGIAEVRVGTYPFARKRDCTKTEILSIPSPVK